MTTFRIEPNPTFSVTVAVPRAGGEAVEVPFTFKFLNREQLAEHFDKKHEHQKALAELVQGGANVREVTAAAMDRQVETLQGIVTAWGFEDEFSEEALRAFVKTSAAAPEAVIRAFELGYEPARLGN